MPRLRTPLALLTLALALAATPALPAAPAKAAAAPAPKTVAGLEKVTSVEGITEYRLPNGLKVLLFPDPSKQTITVNVTYLVGSRHEGYGETGMAHLLEHMVFKGTPKHPNIPQELTAHGARPNGSTWYDRTNYFETFKASDENLTWALELESDRMVNSFIAKKDLDTEMTVVRNEYERGENDPSSILNERVTSTAYLWHNYGKSTIGARSDLENVPIERLQAFYRKYYQPDNAVLLVAGQIDEAKTLALVQKTFGKLKRPDRKKDPIFPTYTREPTQDGERSVTLRRVGDVQVAAAGYHVPAEPHPDSAAMELAMLALTDAPGGRLYKALVETRKATSVGGFTMGQPEPGFFYVSAEVRQDQSLADAQAALLSTLDGLAKEPFTQAEVDRARAKILKNFSLALNASDRVGISLSESIGSGDWRLFFLSRDRVRDAKAEDVNRAVLAYLKPSNRTTGLFIPTEKPDRAEIPEAADPAKLLQGYKGDPVVAQGEAFDPTPGAIEPRVVRKTLPSGLKAVFLPKKSRGEAVTVSVTLRHGDEKSLANKAAVADLAGDLLLRGTTKHTRQELEDLFDKLKARVAVGMGGPGVLTARVETTRPNLPAVLDLLAEVLRQPSFPAAELETLRGENLAQIESQRQEPQAMAPNALGRYLSPYPKGDPRYVATFDEQLAEYRAATLEQVKAYHAGLVGASHGEVAVVGDHDPAAVEQQLSKLLGDWKSPAPFARVAKPYVAVPAKAEKLQANDKANAMLLGRQLLELRDDDPDYPALLMGNYMLGGGFLNSRLAVRIRQKEGISYGVGSGFSASPLDRAAELTVYAIYAPENSARLNAALKEELTRAITAGFTDTELTEARAGWLQSRQMSRSQDGALAGLLGAEAYLGRTLAWDADLEKKVAALTPAQIQAAMAKHLDVAKLSLFEAGDFTAAAKKAAAAPGPAAAPAPAPGTK
ncbi:MAG: pitrilysin family protein [Anaeromyxobacter sp.]